MILVDDGSRDDTWAQIVRRRRPDPRVRGLRLGRNVGQTAAMMAGFDHARGRVVVSLDGDLQNDPRDIPALVAKLDEGYDLVCGWRQQRQDKLLLRKVPSWVANRIIRRLTGVPITDNGCSLKAYRRDLLDRISLYAEQHRFIPALSASVGARITEMPVRHHARRFGESKYGISRTVKVLVDLFTLKMITTFRSRPLVGFALAALPLLLGTAARVCRHVVIAVSPTSRRTRPTRSSSPARRFCASGPPSISSCSGWSPRWRSAASGTAHNDVPTAWEVR